MERAAALDARRHAVRYADSRPSRWQTGAESSVHLDSARNNQSEAELREYLVAALIAANKDKEDEAPKQLNGNNGTGGLSSVN
jgi:hypothetical protein